MRETSGRRHEKPSKIVNGRQYVRTVGDVNGDGKADLVGFGLDGVYIVLAQ